MRARQPRLAIKRAIAAALSLFRLAAAGAEPEGFDRDDEEPAAVQALKVRAQAQTTARGIRTRGMVTMLQ